MSLRLQEPSGEDGAPSQECAFLLLTVIQACTSRLPAWELHPGCVGAASEGVMAAYQHSRRLSQHRPLLAEHLSRRAAFLLPLSLQSEG